MERGHTNTTCRLDTYGMFKSPLQERGKKMKGEEEVGKEKAKEEGEQIQRE